MWNEPSEPSSPLHPQPYHQHPHQPARSPHPCSQSLIRRYLLRLHSRPTVSTMPNRISISRDRLDGSPFSTKKSLSSSASLVRSSRPNSANAASILYKFESTSIGY